MTNSTHTDRKFLAGLVWPENRSSSHDWNRLLSIHIQWHLNILNQNSPVSFLLAIQVFFFFIVLTLCSRQFYSQANRPESWHIYPRWVIANSDMFVLYTCKSFQILNKETLSVYHQLLGWKWKLITIIIQAGIILNLSY